MVRLIEAENLSFGNGNGFLDRELEAMPGQVLETVLEQTGARRLHGGGGGQGDAGMGNLGGLGALGGGMGGGLGAQTAAVLFGNNAGGAGGGRVNGLQEQTQTPQRTEVSRPSASTLRQQNTPSHTSTPTARQGNGNNSAAFNRLTIDRAFASAAANPPAQTPSVPHNPPSHQDTNTFTPSHPAITDALRLLDKDTRVRIARELLDEAYEEVKRAVDNYIEKQSYLNGIVEEGEIGGHGVGERNGGLNG